MGSATGFLDWLVKKGVYGKPSTSAQQAAWKQQYFKEQGPMGTAARPAELARQNPRLPRTPPAGSKRPLPITNPSSSGTNFRAATPGGVRPLPRPKAVPQGKGGLWMAGAFKNKGALHKELGVSPDKPIPMSKINEAETTLNKKRQAGTKLTSEQARLSRRLALAKRAKSGDISKMGEGGVVVPFEHIFGPESPYDAVPQSHIDGLISEGIGNLNV